MAQPLGYDPAQKILWQQGLAAVPLQEYRLDSPAFHHRLGQAGQAIAALHQAPVVCNRSVHLRDSVTKLQEMQQLLPQVLPACRTLVDRVVERLVHQAEQLEPQPVALLHGDLHLKNFLIVDDQVALVDLDDLRQGSPWQDIGSFLAALHYRGLLDETPLAAVEQAIQCFCRCYLERVPWPESQLAVDWYTAAALVNERAFRAVTRLQSSRLDVLDLLLARAAQIIGP
jgi:aminoglycoside phosphotransferase (APT) family kinase protein